MKCVWILRKPVSINLTEYWKLFPYCVPPNMQVVWVSADGFISKDCFGKQSEEFEKEWKNGIDELDGTWQFVRNGFVFLVFLSYEKCKNY